MIFVWIIFVQIEIIYSNRKSASYTCSNNFWWKVDSEEIYTEIVYSDERACWTTSGQEVTCVPVTSEE